MTRINCVPVEELTGPHLVAEYRELPRVYGLSRRALARGEDPLAHPDTYRLGPGHVRFFYSRLGYVRTRHRLLITEMQRRGYRPTLLTVPTCTEWPATWLRHWRPTPEALTTCRARLLERTPT